MTNIKKEDYGVEEDCRNKLSINFESLKNCFTFVSWNWQKQS
jgi:hypothetical protein